MKRSDKILATLAVIDLYLVFFLLYFMFDFFQFITRDTIFIVHIVLSAANFYLMFKLFFSAQKNAQITPKQQLLWSFLILFVGLFSAPVYVIQFSEWINAQESF